MNTFKTFLLIALIFVTQFTLAESGTKQASTLWWVIFNSPGECINSPEEEIKCGMLDLFGNPFLESIAAGSPDPTLIKTNQYAEIAVIYATGAISGKSGRISMASSIYRTDKSNGYVDYNESTIADPLGLGRAYEERDAEVHVVLRSHGDAIKGAELEQITSFFDSYCSDPLLNYNSGPNVCQDVQAAAYPSGASGQKSLYRLADQSTVRKSHVNLIRNGDQLTVVLETKLD
jgi:hypothetical protein